MVMCVLDGSRPGMGPIEFFLIVNKIPVTRERIQLNVLKNLS
jgi:hypothetical protein